MAKNNSINNKHQELTINSGATDDPFVQFDINSTGEFIIGVDNDASDSFKISQGSTLGTNDTFVMSSAGERTLPLHSAFLAYRATTASNVTGDATVYTLTGLTELFDQNGDFSSSTFTAPVSGRYQFSMTIKIGGITTHNDTNSQILTSNGNFGSMQYKVSNVKSINNEIAFSKSIVADMDASDTTVFTIVVAGGSRVIDVIGSSSMVTFVSGFLVC